MFPWGDVNVVTAFQITFHTPSAHKSFVCVCTLGDTRLLHQSVLGDEPKLSMHRAASGSPYLHFCCHIFHQDLKHLADSFFFCFS